MRTLISTLLLAWLVWLLPCANALSVVAPVPGCLSNPSTVSRTIGYDADNGTLYGYDIQPKPAFGYDESAILIACERHQARSDTSERYGAFTELLAAEGTALRFSQTTASPWFSAEGNFAGQTISDVAGQLRAGTLTPAQVPVQVVTMDGTTLIANTRSSLALSQAGIPQSSWSLIDMSGNANVVNSITTRLGNNGLTTAGTST